MKIIIAGGRDIALTTYDIDGFVKDSSFTVTTVVSGCQSGVDKSGEAWANSKDIPVAMFPADWSRYDRAAGPARNRQMAVFSDALILIWNGSSMGSASMLNLARKNGLRVHQNIR